MSDDLHDEFWDEHRWEEFLRASDRRADLVARLRETYARDHPPPPADAPEEVHAAWEAGLEEHLARHLGPLESGDGASPLWPLDEDEPEDGEGWKAGLADIFPEAQDVEDLPVYRMAYGLGEAVLNWAEALPEEAKDAVLVDFCHNALQVTAKLAAGHAFGYEPDMLGGNIAMTKRGLSAANRALAALRQLKAAPYLRHADYLRLYEQGQEVRNAVGLHVQVLRERFERDLD
ncbi:MAG: hypothetical protein R3362_10415 [Rhodothermales bacterium]|nr:hypothetical protein [Rhodothermales bacterium]